VDPSGHTRADADTDYARALARQQRHIRQLRERSRTQPNSWLVPARLSDAYLARARLAGDFEDYRAAEKALNRAFERAPRGAGPWMREAQLQFTLHRLERADEALGRVLARPLLDDLDRAEALGLRGDIRLHSGRYDGALRLYRRAEELDDNPTQAFRLAFWHWQTGDFERAEEWFVRALERLPRSAGKPRAWMHLQRGLLDLDRGRWTEALRHYREANEHFTGWWVIHEHIAEAHLNLGETLAARALYRDVAARTGQPAMLAALADLVRDPEKRRKLHERARRAYARQLELVPEAAYGHALPYLLPRQPERALELAERNFALRPGGRARTLLAQALATNGQLGRATRVLEPALQSPYETATVHATASVLLERAGKQQSASRHRRRAEALRPGAVAELAWLP
jgi:tetratricopeptide (TPR) repeat protein